MKAGVGMEERAARHGCTFRAGVKRFNVDAIEGQGPADLADNSRPVVADKMESERAATGGSVGVLALNGDRQADLPVEGVEGGKETVFAVMGNFGAKDAGEASPEVAHPAFQPITAVFSDRGSNRLDQARLIFADDRHDKSACGHGGKCRVRRVGCKPGVG